MNTKIFSATVMVMLIQASAIQAQLTSGGDIAGGYTWLDSKINDQPLRHYAGSGKLWLESKTKNCDWRVTLNGSYKDQESESQTIDLKYTDAGDVTAKTIISLTHRKPLNINTRFDLNWRQPDKSAYKLWAQYGYLKTDNTYFFFSVQQSSQDLNEGDVRGEVKEERSHHVSVGYSGTTMLNASGWVLKSAAEVELTKKQVENDWGVFLVDVTNPEDATCKTIREWRLHPHYTDWRMNASLLTADTLLKTSASRLMLGGGLRFMAESEKYLHGGEVATEFNGASTKVDCLDQHATGFRYFIEPFFTGEWKKGKWLLSAEYGIRLYHTNTTDNRGTAVTIYNLMDPEHPLSNNSISHFTPLLTGEAKLTRQLSKRHSLTLENKVGSRLPNHQQSVLGFVQSVEYNKVILGNPNIKPEVSSLCALSHTYSDGHFSATTSASAEWTHNQMSIYLYGCTIDGWNENAQIALNVADVATYTLRERLAWNSKWLTAQAEIWGCLAHHQGTGAIFDGTELDDSSWGWKLGAKVKLGHGWQVNTDFQYKGGYKTVAMDMSRSWQMSNIAVEKQFKHITLYLNGRNLIDPALQMSINDTEGKTIYNFNSRMNNRMVMIGCRWSL